MHSYASVTQSYAPVCLHTPHLRLRTQTSRHTFSQNANKSKNSSKSQNYNCDQARQIGPDPTQYIHIYIYIYLVIGNLYNDKHFFDLRNPRLLSISLHIYIYTGHMVLLSSARCRIAASFIPWCHYWRINEVGFLRDNFLLPSLDLVAGVACNDFDLSPFCGDGPFLGMSWKFIGKSVSHLVQEAKTDTTICLGKYAIANTE